MQERPAEEKNFQDLRNRIGTVMAEEFRHLTIMEAVAALDLIKAALIGENAQGIRLARECGSLASAPKQ